MHTHDTAGAGVASMLAAAEAGADVVDGAIDAMSGLTSQPSLGALIANLRGTDLATGIPMEKLTPLNTYWENVRALYAPFESGQLSGSSDVYMHEIPGGQYTNLLYQSRQLGLTERWSEIKQAYAQANILMGDIPKVTPSSKVVGDLAQFMVAQRLTPQDVHDQARPPCTAPHHPTPCSALALARSSPTFSHLLTPSHTFSTLPRLRRRPSPSPNRSSSTSRARSACRPAASSSRSDPRCVNPHTPNPILSPQPQP